MGNLCAGEGSKPVLDKDMPEEVTKKDVKSLAVTKKDPQPEKVEQEVTINKGDTVEMNFKADVVAEEKPVVVVEKPVIVEKPVVVEKIVVVEKPVVVVEQPVVVVEQPVVIVEQPVVVVQQTPEPVVEEQQQEVQEQEPEVQQEEEQQQEEEEPKIVLGYWKIRGVGQQLRLMLEYLGVRYREDMYEQGGQETNYSVEEWTSVKDTLGLSFPNLPYLITEDIKLTEAKAIQIYLGQKYDSSLLGKNIEDQTKVDVLYSQYHDIKKAITGPCHMPNFDRDRLKTICLHKMKPVVDVMGDNQYIIGDYLTYIDFNWFELIQFVNFLTEGEFLKQNPTQKEYFMRIKNLPSISAYMDSDRYMKKPFNNKIAPINNL